MFDFLEKYIMGPMTTLSQFRMIRSITQAGMASISFTIVGSVFLILNVLPQAFPVLEGLWAMSFNHITEIYMLANHATIGCIAIYFLIGTAFEYARILSEEDGIDIKPINAVLMSIMALFMLAPQVGVVDGLISRITNIVQEDGAYTSVVYNGWEVGGDGPANFGATGIFCAFIIAWFSVRIYALCVDKNIVIKLPDVVPDGVARSFTALVPGVFVALVCMIIQAAFMAFGTNFYDFIAIPFGFVVNIVGTYPGMIVIYFLIHALWLVGIHGATIVTSPLTAVALSNLAMNAEGTGIGVYAGEYNNAFVTLGGSGCTLGLTILMLVLAKSEQLKAIGKAEIVPAFFNINEPLIFGLPVVYNPSLAVPFIIAPIVAMSISYWAIALGIIPPVIVQMPWPTPIALGAFISTGGSIMAPLVAILDVVVATLIYFPFFKRFDNQLYKEEQEKAAAEKA